MPPDVLPASESLDVPASGDAIASIVEADAPDGVDMADEAAPTGAILSLLPDAPESLAMPGGDPPGDLHVTMVYLADDAATLDGEQIAAISQAAQGVGGGPITAEIAGVAVLGENGAVVLLLESEELAARQAALLAAVQATGAPIAEQHEQFIAHLTLGYPTVPADMVSAAAPLVGQQVTFGSLGFHLGGEVFDRPLEGIATPAEPEDVGPVAPDQPAQPVPGTFRIGTTPKAKKRWMTVDLADLGQLANQFHDEDGLFAPKGAPKEVIEMAAKPKPPAVLVGLKVADPSTVKMVPQPGLPYMVDGSPYVALLEVKADPAAVAAAVANVELEPATSKGVSALSASGPLRRAILIDPVGVVDAYKALRTALSDAGLKPADYPFAVQLGVVSKEDAKALKGTEMTFDGVIVVNTDGSVAGAAAANQEEAPMNDSTQMGAKKMTCSDCGADMTNGTCEFCSKATMAAATCKACGGELAADGSCPTCGDSVEMAAATCTTCGGELAADGSCPTCDDSVEMAAATCKACGGELAADGSCPTCSAAEVAPTATMATDSNVARWEGMLAVEGVMSGDGRKIELEALSWRNLPLPLMMMTQNPVGGQGHDGAQLAGRIDWIERREDGQVWGGGVLDLLSPSGMEAARLITPDAEGRQFLRGVSVDLDDVEMEMAGDGDPVETLMSGGTLSVGKARIMGATLTPFPAFQEAQVVLVGESLTASLLGEECDCDLAAALVAAAGEGQPGVLIRLFTPADDPVSLVAAGIPIDPPLAWFDRPRLDGPTPLRVDESGRVYGHVASWGSCHIGFRDRCVGVPKSASNYRYFANKQTMTAEGKLVATGPIVVDTVHPDLRMRASDAQAFYADTGCAVADVALYEDEHGIVAAGALRPNATPMQVRKLRGSDVSPDWRSINGRLECVGLLAVNTSGFVTPAMVASAGKAPAAPGRIAARIDGEGAITSLVAAGMISHEGEFDASPVIAALQAQLAELAALVGPIADERRQQLAARQAAARERIEAPIRAARQARADAARMRLTAPLRARHEEAAARFASPKGN